MINGKDMFIFTQEEYEKLREKYIFENMFKEKIKPFFHSKFPVVKNYVYYDNPVLITEDASLMIE